LTGNKKEAFKKASFFARLLYLAEQQQHQQDDQDHTENTRRTITPATGVREHWKATDQ